MKKNKFKIEFVKKNNRYMIKDINTKNYIAILFTNKQEAIDSCYFLNNIDKEDKHVS